MHERDSRAFSHSTTDARTLAAMQDVAQVRLGLAGRKWNRRRHLRHFEFQPPPANNCISQNKPPSDKLWLSQLELFASSNHSIT